VGHASRSSSLLHMKASLARVSQSGLKTGGGATGHDCNVEPMLKFDNSINCSCSPLV
jgi:hypothetical protein